MHGYSGRSPNVFARLVALLERLDGGNFWYRLDHIRDDAILVDISVPGERWEVELFEDGHIEFERFLSNGEIEDADGFEALLREYEDSAGN